MAHVSKAEIHNFLLERKALKQTYRRFLQSQKDKNLGFQS